MNYFFKILVIVTCIINLSSCDNTHDLPVVTDSIYQNKLGPLCWPTHVIKNNNQYIITDYRNNRFLIGLGDEWESSTLDIKGAHSLAVDSNGNYIIDDTENNRIIITKSLNNNGVIKYIDTVKGKPLQRPHDIEISENGDIYVIDSVRLLRISRDYNHVDELWFESGDLGYARALKIIDGSLYVINSSHGNIIKINSFDDGKYQIIHTLSSKKRDAAGSYDRTGPIINDIEKYNGWYYASNYFTKSWAKGTDPEKNKLIRWKSWEDFTQGHFEDMSYLMPIGQLPYFMTVDNDKLLITTFNHEQPCVDESIIVVDGGNYVISHSNTSTTHPPYNSSHPD